MLTIEPRLRAAARKHRGSKSVVTELSIQLSTSRKKKQDAEDEIRWCEGFLEFQQREAVTEYQGTLKIYEIEDGETHMVSATSKEHALEFYGVKLTGYESVEEYQADMGPVEVLEQLGDTVIPVHDVDDTGKLVVRTAAEWAIGDAEQVVSTTVY